VPFVDPTDASLGPRSWGSDGQSGDSQGTSVGTEGAVNARTGAARGTGPRAWDPPVGYLGLVLGTCDGAAGAGASITRS
jgi:hypothetical protein